jgi:polyisoprenoid-binding protein YceI
MRIDAGAAECLVYTFKEGLLSPVAHDLQLRVERFTVDVEARDGGFTVDARFDARSLRVVTAMAHGQPREGALGEADRRKIEHTIVDEVLDAARHPEVHFRSTKIARAGAGYRVDGELTLAARTRAISALTRPSTGAVPGQTAEVVLHQPDFGIRPYSAMLGTLKIRPDVRVRITLPEPGAA